MLLAYPSYNYEIPGKYSSQEDDSWSHSIAAPNFITPDLGLMPRLEHPDPVSVMFACMWWGLYTQNRCMADPIHFDHIQLDRLIWQTLIGCARLQDQAKNAWRFYTGPLYLFVDKYKHLGKWGWPLLFYNNTFDTIKYRKVHGDAICMHVSFKPWKCPVSGMWHIFECIYSKPKQCKLMVILVITWTVSDVRS